MKESGCADINESSTRKTLLEKCKIYDPKAKLICPYNLNVVISTCSFTKRSVITV